jgi:hypothetical protein
VSGSPQCLDGRRFGDCTIAENYPHLEHNVNWNCGEGKDGELPANAE